MKTPIELKKVKPEPLSRRLSTAYTVLRSGGTRVRTALTVRCTDDEFMHTDEGAQLRRALWAFKHDLDVLLPRLARLRNHVRQHEVLVRDRRKFAQLGVDPQEVLNRDSH